MTRLKGMDNDNEVFTVAVSDGQLTISVPVKVLEEYDPTEISSWVSDNAGVIDETCRVAIANEFVESQSKTNSEQVKK